MSGRKVFTAGEVLQAADVNDFLMDQSVMVFAGTAARGSAIPSPTEGMVTYLEDSDQVQVYNGSSFAPIGTILQVVSTTKTDTFSASVATTAESGDVTGLTASISPSSTSNKVLVTVNASVAVSNNRAVFVSLFRGGARSAFVGDSVGSRQQVSVYASGASVSTVQFQAVAFTFLDSPSTTSSTTYSVRLSHDSTGTQTVYVNRSGLDTNDATIARGASSITLMEVTG